MRLVILLLFSSLIFSQEKEESLERGKLLYQDLCSRCHMPDGKGVVGIYPPLAKSDYLFNKLKESILAVKEGGIEGEIIVNGIKYNTQMENLGLYEDEVADVVNYILNSWGNKYDKTITEEYIKNLK